MVFLLVIESMGDIWEGRCMGVYEALLIRHVISGLLGSVCLNARLNSLYLELLDVCFDN